MATFNDTDLGPVVTMQTSRAAQLQVTAYPGVNGLAINALGARGANTTAKGVCYADDEGALATVENQFHNYVKDSTLGALVDTEGTTWTNVVMTGFKPVGMIEFAPGYGAYREYEMSFLHC